MYDGMSATIYIYVGLSVAVLGGINVCWTVCDGIGRDKCMLDCILFLSWCVLTFKLRKSKVTEKRSIMSDALTWLLGTLFDSTMAVILTHVRDLENALTTSMEMCHLLMPHAIA